MPPRAYQCGGGIFAQKKIEGDLEEEEVEVEEL